MSAINRLTVPRKRVIAVATRRWGSLSWTSRTGQPQSKCLPVKLQTWNSRGFGSNLVWDVRLNLALRGMCTASGRGSEGGAGAAGGGGAGAAGGQQSGGREGKKGKDEGSEENENFYDEPEEEGWTPKAVFQTVAFLGVVSLAGVCLYNIVVELMPSRMAPNTVLSDAFEVIKSDPDTANHFGTPLKVYGRDTNRHREGRRNFVEHIEYKEKSDDSKRTRVRFNLEGPYGHGLGFAEVSSKMDSGEWVYLCVQDSQTGHVITLHDNRAFLASQSLASSKEERDALSTMLGKGS